MADVRITDITGTITTSDGKVREFTLGPEGASQWGLEREGLGNTVEALTAMQEALREGDHLADDDEAEAEHEAAEQLSVANHEIDSMRADA